MKGVKKLEKRRALQVSSTILERAQEASNYKVLGWPRYPFEYSIVI